MKRRNAQFIAGTLLVVLSILLAACQPVQPPPPAPEGPQMATAKVNTMLSNQPGRAIVSARGNHFVVDSVPPLNGPNEELNPLDMILTSLATCGIFVAERAANELNVPLDSAVATVEADFDPSGVAGAQADPRIQAFRVSLDLHGASQEQVEDLVDNFIRRCPIYTTLIRSAPIEISTDGQMESTPMEGLATASVTAQLSNQPGRAIVNARGNHFVIDSVPPLDGPNEERNPLDMILGALGTCGTFVYEKAAEEMGIPLNSLAATVEADFYPQGVVDGSVNPRIQALRVHMQLDGPDAEQAEMLAGEFQARCPIFTTLVRSAPIELSAAVN